MRRFILAVTMIAITTNPSAGQENRTVEVIKTNEYMMLPEQAQTIYVAGLIDGMAYAAYNYQVPDHDEWVACVQSTPLGELIEQMNSLIAVDPEYQNQPVSYALTRIIGLRRPC